MPNIVKLLRSIVSGNAPTLTQIQNYILSLNAADGKLHSWNSGANAVDQTWIRGLDYSARAYVNISGGGTLAWDGNGISWSTRFIVMNNGRHASNATVGYFDIIMPADGTVITGVGGRANVTVASGRIPMVGWDVLYYILPLRGVNTSLAANFRISSYTADVDIPSHWVPIAIWNADLTQMKFSAGYILSAGEAYDTTTSYSSKISTVNSTKITKSGDSVTGQIVYPGFNSTTGIATFVGDGGNLQVRAAGGGTGTATMTFHRPGLFAVHFGIDTDNEFKFGGWSEGLTAYRFWTSKNFTPGDYTLKVNANVTGSLTITGATNPNLYIVNSGNAADLKNTQMYTDSSGTFFLRFVNDAASASYNILSVARSATTGPTSFTVSTNLSVVGDIVASRGNGTGAYYFSTAGGTRYMIYNGTNYYLNGADLFINNTTWRVGSKLIYGSNTALGSVDLNTVTTPGFYDGNTFTNGPLGTTNWLYIEVAQWSTNATYVLQKANVLEFPGAMYYRTMVASVWTQWVKSMDSCTQALGSVTTGTATFNARFYSKTTITNGGAHTWAFVWPTTLYGEMEITLTNGGAFAITMPSINWLKGDGTYSTTFSSQGVTLNTSGINTIIVWTPDGGTTLFTCRLISILFCGSIPETQTRRLLCGFALILT